MRIRRGIRLALLLACARCAGGPSSPSPAPPSLTGTYLLSVTRCALPGEAGPIAMSFQCGAQETTWSAAQQGGTVTGINDHRIPPFICNGTFTGTVTNAGAVQITAMQYRDSSSHTFVQQLTVTGGATVDRAGFHGTLTGDYSSTAVYGGYAAPTSNCHGDAMPFQFTRLP